MHKSGACRNRLRADALEHAIDHFWLETSTCRPGAASSGCLATWDLAGAPLTRAAPTQQRPSCAKCGGRTSLRRLTLTVNAFRVIVVRTYGYGM